MFDFFGIKLTLADIKEVLALLFALAGLILAAIGLNTWNYQLKGAYKFDLAKETKILVFQMSMFFERIQKSFNETRYYSVFNDNTGEEEIREYLHFVDLCDDFEETSKVVDFEELKRLSDKLCYKLIECDSTFETKGLSPFIRHQKVVEDYRRELLFFKEIGEQGLTQFENIREGFRAYFFSEKIQDDYISTQLDVTKLLDGIILGKKANWFTKILFKKQKKSLQADDDSLTLPNQSRRL